MIVEGNEREDSIGFDDKTKHLFASAYSYEIAGVGYVEIDEQETRAIYKQMKKVFEKEATK